MKERFDPLKATRGREVREILQRREATLVRDYFEIEEMKRSPEWSKDDLNQMWRAQMVMLGTILDSPILKKDFFVALDAHLEEVRRKNGKV